MDEPLPRPETTLVVIMGASEFPLSPNLDRSEALLNSANDVRRYFLDEGGFVLPEENLLWLFDKEYIPVEQDEKITGFFKEQSDRFIEQGFKLEDVIIYYTGHGKTPSEGFLLALRSTKATRETETSYTASLLQRTLSDPSCMHVRKYLILDCCFAASIITDFIINQSDSVDVIFQQTIDILEDIPGRGTAVLCASGPSDPARIIPGEKYTMFSGALLEVLTSGNKSGPKNFTLRSLKSYTNAIIVDKYKEKYPEYYVSPEFHSPEQDQGDVGAVPIFPNIALKPEPIRSILGRHADEISRIKQELDKYYSRLIEIDESVGALSEHIDSSKQSPIITSAGQDTTQSSPPMATRFLSGISFLTMGITVGWLVGMSVSVIPPIIISIVVGLYAMIVATLHKDEYDSFQHRLSLINTDPFPFALFSIGILIGSFVGVYTRAAGLIPFITGEPEHPPTPTFEIPSSSGGGDN